MAPSPTDSKRIAEAQKLAKSEPSKAESIFKDVLGKGPGTGEAALRDYETALMGLGELYRDQKKPNELSELVTNSRSTLSSFAKAKTAKIGIHHKCRLSSPILNLFSTPTPRPPLRHPQHRRHPNLHHQIMHRMGHLRTPQFPPPKPRNPPRLPLHAKTSILRRTHSHQRPPQRTKAPRRQARPSGGPTPRIPRLPRPRQPSQSPRRPHLRPHIRCLSLHASLTPGGIRHAIGYAPRRGQGLQHSLLLLHRSPRGLPLARRSAKSDLRPPIHAPLQNHAQPRRRRQRHYDRQTSPQILGQEPRSHEIRRPSAFQPLPRGIRTRALELQIRVGQ